MKIAEVIKAVKAHRGKIYVSMMARDDAPYVQVVKLDLLDVLSKLNDDQVVWSVLDGDGYVDNY